MTAFEEKTDVLETLKGHTYGPSTEITAISVSLLTFWKYFLSLLFMHAWLYIITLIYFHDSFTGFSHWSIRAKSTIAILHKTWRMPQENRNRKVIQIIYEKLWFNEYHISTQAMAQWLCLIRNLTYKVQLHFHLLSSFQEETIILHLRPEVPP